MCFPKGPVHAILNFPWLCGFGSKSCSEYLGKFLKIERYGFEKVDAIDYYTQALIESNAKVSIVWKIYLFRCLS
jgi:hypothetical protein